MKIILIGYRCTGKTVVGRRLAERLGVPFYDTDELVRQQTGKTIKELVDEKGWDGFRVAERAVIKRLPLSTDAIIAAGGGAITDPQNRKTLKHHGLCVWLTADVRTIVERMKKDQASNAARPPLSSSGLEQETAVLLEARRLIYQQLADCICDTSGKEIDAIADEVLGALRRGLSDQERSRAT